MKKFSIPCKLSLSTLAAVLLGLTSHPLLAQNSKPLAKHQSQPEAAPDLVIAAAPQVSATLPPAGGTTVVTTTVQNVGTRRAGFSVLGYYLSADAVLSSDDVLVGETITTAIAANNSLEVKTELAIPAGTRAGARYLLGVADYLNLVREQNDGNNVWSAKLTVAAPGTSLPLADALPSAGSPAPTGQLIARAQALAAQPADADLSITPNPVAAATPLRVQLSAAEAAATATLALYNSQGQQVARQALALVPGQPSQTEFMTAGLATGVYVLHVISPGRHATRRVVIE